MGRKIHPTAQVSPGAQLGEGVQIGPYCRVGAEVILGENCHLRSHVVISGKTVIGAEGDIYPFTVIGEIGPNWQPAEMRNTGLVIGERAVIREMSTIHGGTGPQGTQVGSHVLLMVGSHIGHDCVVGDHVILSNYVQVGGHCRLEEHVSIGGMSVCHQFASIGKHAFVGGATAVLRDIMPFSLNRGTPCVFKTVNKVGLKRGGYSLERILQIRKAYKELFAEEVSLMEGLDRLMQNYKGDRDIEHIVTFCRESKRSLCTPHHGWT